MVPWNYVLGQFEKRGQTDLSTRPKNRALGHIGLSPVFKLTWNFRHKVASRIVIPGVQPAEEIAFHAARPKRCADAWLEEMFEEHYARIVGMLARLAGDRGQAEEIAADVFCKLARGGALAGGGENRTAWLYRVAANAGIDAARRNSRRRDREREAMAERLRAGGQPGALDAMLLEERRGRVQAVLAMLKPRDAQLLLLRSTGMAYRELAGTLGIQPGSVGTLLARAEAEFERRFRARYGDEV